MISQWCVNIIFTVLYWQFWRLLEIIDILSIIQTFMLLTVNMQKNNRCCGFIFFIPAPDSIAPSSRRCDQSYGLGEFTIFSPDHPSYYPSDVYCRFVVIRSSSEVCGLEVNFISFDVEDYYQCQRDYLDIDGEKLCGILPPQSVSKWAFFSFLSNNYALELFCTSLVPTNFQW